MKKLLIITNRNLSINAPLANIQTAAREVKEINMLLPYYDICTIGHGAYHNIVSYSIDKLQLNFIEKVARKLLRKISVKSSFTIIYPWQYYKFKKQLKNIQPDIIICHDPKLLPILFKLRQANKYAYKIVFNAHEHYPLEFEDANFIKFDKPMYEYIYKKYVSNIDLLINVCESIRQKCIDDYKVDSIVIPNSTPYYNNIKPKQVDANSIKLIHTGATLKARKLEVMIDMIKFLPQNYSLSFMLIPGDMQYYNQLKTRAEEVGRITFLNPVAYDEVVPILSDYDMGIFILSPTSYNYQVALPNKLFEYVQARLSIAVSPNIEMKHFVQTNNIGVVANEYTAESMAKAILNLSANDIFELKINANNKAKVLCNEYFQQILINAISKL
jgi:glycosyltransferase involved in cell wall biosynthesis